MAKDHGSGGENTQGVEGLVGCLGAGGETYYMPV